MMIIPDDMKRELLRYLFDAGYRVVPGDVCLLDILLVGAEAKLRQLIDEERRAWVDKIHGGIPPNVYNSLTSEERGRIFCYTDDYQANNSPDYTIDGKLIPVIPMRENNL